LKENSWDFIGTNRCKEDSTLNIGFKGTKKLKTLIVENCRCLKHNVQPPDTSVTIDVQKKEDIYIVCNIG